MMNKLKEVMQTTMDAVSTSYDAVMREVMIYVIFYLACTTSAFAR